MKHNNSNDSQSKLIAAIASGTSSPFKVAFKATLGVMVAQALGALLGLLTLGLIAVGVGLVIKLLA